MWVVVLVADEDPFDGAAHAMEGVVVLQASQARVDGGVFFWLWCFCGEVIVGEWVEAERLWLVCVEWEGLDGWVGGLEVGGWYGRHCEYGLRVRFGCGGWRVNWWRLDECYLKDSLQLFLEDMIFEGRLVYQSSDMFWQWCAGEAGEIGRASCRERVF